MELCLDVWQIIMDKSDLKTQISLSSTCKFFSMNLKIHKFTLEKFANEKCLTIGRLESLKKFKIRKTLENINLMTTLESLKCECKINQKSINHLNLKKLYIRCNSEITSIAWMYRLESLDCSYNCGINQRAIEGLNLIKLNACGNEKITDVSWMIRLEKLYCSGCCGIDQRGIKGLNLKRLLAYSNEKINCIV